jgi:apolipoprotein D and lipocalin family protein
MKHVLRLSALAILLALCAAVPAPGQTPTAVAKLDLNQFIGTWYVIERLPIHREKLCIGDEMVLYALGDKRNSFQMVTSCALKDDNSNFWDDKGKLDPAGSGALKLSCFLFLHCKYWVLATAPDYTWMVVGTPNHKSIWILSKTTTLAPDALSAAVAQASAAGFDPTKLVKIPQHN